MYYFPIFTTTHVQITEIHKALELFVELVDETLALVPNLKFMRIKQQWP